jgi:hypothetical protein
MSSLERKLRRQQNKLIYKKFSHEFLQAKSEQTARLSAGGSLAEGERLIGHKPNQKQFEHIINHRKEQIKQAIADQIKAQAEASAKRDESIDKEWKED